MSVAKRLLSIYDTVRVEKAKGRSLSDIKADLSQSYPPKWVDYMLKEEESLSKSITIK